MKKNVFIFTLLIVLNTGELFSQNKSSKEITSNKLKKKDLIFGPKSAAKIKDLFFSNKEFKLPQKIRSINSIANYTGVQPIDGSGSTYIWDFTNGFQLSAISEGGGSIGGNDKISLVSFNYGGLNSLELSNSIILHKSTLSSIEKIYTKRLIKFKNTKLPTYKIISDKFYATFYFNEKNILISLTISNYDLEF
jgi:hypothetical protein